MDVIEITDEIADSWVAFCTVIGACEWFYRPGLHVPAVDYVDCVRDAEAGNTDALAKLARFTAWRLTK